MSLHFLIKNMTKLKFSFVSRNRISRGETIFVNRTGAGTLQVYVQPRYDVILIHEGAKASGLDHTSINLNKRHYRGSHTKFEIHIPQTVDTIQQDRSNDPPPSPTIGETWRRHCRINYTRYYLRILSWILHFVLKGTKSRYIINFQLTTCRIGM